MTTTFSTPRLPLAVPAVVAAAWLLAVAAQIGGDAELLHHDALIEGGLPVGAAVVLFLLAWQVMLAAMMVPSSLPLIRLFTAAARQQQRSGLVLAAFLGGYALVWSLFGAAAFLGDLGVHTVVENTGWLSEREYLIAGSTLALAGGYQFTPLKRRCLTQCRLPGSFLAANYERGIGGAFRLGRSHGLFCVGCCAALMLLMFAAGVANLLWMATLTALMVYEKTGRAGHRAVSIAGAALVAWAAAVLIQPAWLPAFLTGAL